MGNATFDVLLLSDCIEATEIKINDVKQTMASVCERLHTASLVVRYVKTFSSKMLVNHFERLVNLSIRGSQSQTLDIELIAQAYPNLRLLHVEDMQVSLTGGTVSDSKARVDTGNCQLLELSRLEEFVLQYNGMRDGGIFPTFDTIRKFLDACTERLRHVDVSHVLLGANKGAYREEEFVEYLCNCFPNLEFITMYMMDKDDWQFSIKVRNTYCILFEVRDVRATCRK